MELKAMFYPKGGPTAEFAVPVSGRNVELLRQVAIRTHGLNVGRKNLKAKSLIAEESASDRLQIIARPAGLIEVGFDFQKVFFDCSSGHAPSATFSDERRERSMRIQLSDPEIQTLIGLDAQDVVPCAFCQESMSETDILKGDGICSPCVVART